MITATAVRDRIRRRLLDWNGEITSPVLCGGVFFRHFSRYVSTSNLGSFGRSV